MIGTDTSSRDDPCRMGSVTAPRSNRVRVDPAEELRTVDDDPVAVALCAEAIEHMLNRPERFGRSRAL